jgi:hypothetical protein
MMLAASIATITAFIVVNFNFKPAIVLWLAPTCKRRVNSGTGVGVKPVRWLIV